MRSVARLLNKTCDFTPTLSIGQQMRGKVGSYRILSQLAPDRDVWKATDQSARDVVVKRALPHLLTIERNILEVADGYNCIRQLIHYIEDPPSLVLEYLDDNTLEVSRRDRLESTNLKFVARTLLEALAALHEKGYVHTDVKPDNVLINHGKDGKRFSRVALGDCGDVQPFNPNADPLEEGHAISAAVFRSPEAQLNLRWGPPTDIWSLGITLISLFFGGDWHICAPANFGVHDEHYVFWVFVEQVRRFGPFKTNFEEIADPECLEICSGAIDYIIENKKWLPFRLSGEKELALPDRDFIARMVKLDPRDRPTANELLQDAWFNP